MQDTKSESEEEEEETEEEAQADEETQPAEEQEEPEVVKESSTEKRRHSAMQKPEEEPKQLTEAEMAMLAAKKRHEEEEATKMLEYEEKRKIEKERIEEELKELKQKQLERKKQREEEFREMAERRMEEEKRKHDEELERKARIEAQRRRKEEERRKKHDLSSGFGDDEPGKNYTIDEAGKKIEIPTSLGKGKNSEMIAAEKEEAKRNYLAAVSRLKMDTNNMLPNDLKEKIKQLHAKICKLEADKYDLEKRNERQEYDLKELNERQLQVARHKAVQKGLNPDEAVASQYPPKVNVASKFDRQIDRRSYTDRREIYEHPPMPKQRKLVRGTARPPPEWGRRDIEELEVLRKTADRRQYVEVVKAEGDAAKPPVTPIPLVVPEDSDSEETGTAAKPEPPPKPEATS